MFKKIQNYFNKKKLEDKKYTYLFEKNTDNEYVCFDCETTGLDTVLDDIISIGAVLIKNNTIITSKKFVRFVKPKSKLQNESVKIHHIRECDLSNACDIDVVLDEFLEFIGNRPLVGYYLEFDIKMINKYLKNKIGITLPNKTIEISELYYDWKMETIPQGNIDLRFDTLVKTLNIPKLSKHDAFNDSVMSAMMFLKLKNQPKVRI